MDGYLDNQLMFLGWLSHGMAMPVADADGPFIISEITNKLIFWWTIVSSSFQDFAYCITREIIFSNPAQKLFLLWRHFIDRYVQIVGEGDGVKKVYMDGYLDNQLMLLGWLSHEMALPVADADGPFIISEITNKLVFGWTIVSSSFQGDGVKKVYMDGYLDNQLMLLGWLSHGMAMPVAYADGPFIISEITNKLVFGWTIVSSSFQDFAYCCTHEHIFSNPDQKLFLLCRFIDRYMQIVGEGDGVKKVYMDGYLDNRLMLLGWLSHGMAMPVADVDGPFIISEIINKLVFGWTIVSSSFQDFAYCLTRELIFSNPAQKLFLLFCFIDRYVQIVGERDGVKKVYMDGYLDNQLMLLGWLSHRMAMLVAYADAPFIISVITIKLVFGWTIMSSSFQDFAYCGTRYGVKKVYMDGYLDNQLMFLGWLSHGMAMPVADVDGPFIISEITNKLVFGWTIVSSSFQDFAYSGTRELIFSNPPRNGNAGGRCRWPFIISEITNKIIFGWTIVSSSLKDFAYRGTRELIFSNPAQKGSLSPGMAMPVADVEGRLLFLKLQTNSFLGYGVKKVYMDGNFDNQLMFLGSLSHEMALPVADADGPFIISEITNKLVFGWTIMSSSFQDFAYCGTRELIFSIPAQKFFLLCRFIDRYVHIVGEGEGVKKVYMDGYLDNQMMFLGSLSHGIAMSVADADGPFIIS
ncbi:hypothetical protein CASFOL_022485 [Castilleja foliolosa]|uniref:Uncharacterized protein n=1 Tax=Castilleja foliolosa TaxID=1961234 RepID=A0ABD3CVL7_9LAMI